MQECLLTVNSIKLIAPELINDNTQNELGNSWHYDDAISKYTRFNFLF